jgi:predicted RNase H-related nuclease YkuK (DUF458 family)
MFKRVGYEQIYDLGSMVEIIKEFAIEAKKNYKPMLYISTDSQIFNKKISYATSIVCHRSGKTPLDSGGGAIMFYTRRKERVNNNTHLTVRIIQETKDSLDIIDKILQTDLIDIIGVENFWIDIDAGLNGKSREILASCIGMVESYGINSRYKPQGLTSHAADKMCRG